MYMYVHVCMCVLVQAKDGGEGLEGIEEGRKEEREKLSVCQNLLV